MTKYILMMGTLLSTLALTPAPLPAQSAAATSLTLNISGMRNQRGNILVCVTRQPRHFPNCSVDPGALKAKIPARQATKIHFKSIAAGTWAVAMLHDENANNDLDTTLSMPDEGFGFSRNPVVYRTAPKFSAAAFKVGTTPAAMSIRMQYLN
jgi:uncharacterized protein (DUF2141 family)